MNTFGKICCKFLFFSPWFWSSFSGVACAWVCMDSVRGQRVYIYFIMTKSLARNQSELLWLPAWWALRLARWPLAECSNDLMYFLIFTMSFCYCFIVVFCWRKKPWLLVLLLLMRSKPKWPCALLSSWVMMKSLPYYWPFVRRIRVSNA